MWELARSLHIRLNRVTRPEGESVPIGMAKHLLNLTKHPTPDRQNVFRCTPCYAQALAGFPPSRPKDGPSMFYFGSWFAGIKVQEFRRRGLPVQSAEVICYFRPRLPRDPQPQLSGTVK